MTVPSFDKYVVHGDFVEWEQEDFHMRATVLFDPDTTPMDYDMPGWCFDTSHPEFGKRSRELIESWKADEWFYCGVRVTASKEGLELGEETTWGVEANFPDADGNPYLSELADCLAVQAIEAANDRITRLCATRSCA